ncbi:MAG: hypothetical protein WCQ21_00520 [Verrucomicrobiota bacterium]|jgi:hypothetical protein
MELSFIMYLNDHGKTYSIGYTKDQFWMTKVLINAPSNPLRICPGGPVPADRGATAYAGAAQRPRGTVTKTGIYGSAAMTGATG